MIPKGYRIAVDSDEVARCACGEVWHASQARPRLKPAVQAFLPEPGEPTAQVYLDCTCGSTLGIWAAPLSKPRPKTSSGYAMLVREGDAQCSNCFEMYWSGTGHKRYALCRECK